MALTPSQLIIFADICKEVQQELAFERATRIPRWKTWCPEPEPAFEDVVYIHETNGSITVCLKRP